MNELRPGEDFDFMKEKIKERPINKKKLIRKTIITASMAVIFGLVACLTFLVLEPLFSNWLYPEEEPKQVIFPPETEEMLPEDMLIGETQTGETAEGGIEGGPEEIPGETQAETETEPEDELEVEDYQLLYDKLYELAQEVNQSMVTVTGVTEDVDWFNNPYETKGQTSGVIVADNGREYLILVDRKPIEEVETIRVTFTEDIQAPAQIKGIDSITGLAVISVTIKDLPPEAPEYITVASLGSSGGRKMLGKPVLALGSPNGTDNSIAYGMITSAGSSLHLPDSSLKLLTTDLYGSTKASGVLINMNGEVVGIINQNYTREGMENQLCAIGISELKSMITRLSDGHKRAYFGIYGTNVTEEANIELHVPLGAYVTEIAMSSPAMQAGIQSGDIIVKIGEDAVNSYQDYIKLLEKIVPDEQVVMTIMRQGPQEYTEIEVPVIPRGA